VVSFRLQLALLLSGLLLLFAVVAGFLSVAAVRRALREDANVTAMAAADARAADLSATVRLRQHQTQALLESVASNCDASGHVNSACAGAAAGAWMRDQHANYAELSFPSMRKVRRGIGAPPPDAVLYATADGTLHIGVSAHDDYSGGKLIVAFNASDVQHNFLRPFGNDSAGDMMLVSGTGVLIMGEPGDISPLPQGCPAQAGKLALAHPSAIVAYHRAAELGNACVVAQLPLADILRPMATLRYRFVILAGAFLLIALVAALLVAQLLARPLERLSKRVQALSRGDYDSPVPQEGAAEIRDFAAAFAAAAASLKTSRDTLVQSHERLQMTYRAARLWPWEMSLRTRVFSWTDFAGDEPQYHEEDFSETLARVHPDDVETVIAALERGEALGQYEAEFRYRKPDGEQIWIASRGQKIERDGEPLLIGVNSDITQRRRVQEIERERENLAASAAIAAELAHEINNPLAAVTGALYLIQEAPSKADSDRYLTIAIEGGRRITRIARQLLGLYSSRTTGSAVDVCALIEDVVTGAKGTASERAVDVQVEFRDRPLIFGRPDELRTALTNVLANAVSHTKESGRVRVRVRRSQEWDVLGRAGVRIVVADEGPGISPPHLRQIFKAFFSTKDERGSGLGLWIVNNIVRKHYGTIRARSRQKGPRRGTTVSIFLPLADHETIKMNASSASAA
jgi:signal transduction histidine kinase/HAMP domain-containing protein